ncbi:MAG: hypothetical protein LUG60_10785 [Erysipelotrichaceae bacterium]|nr:hypothetical protein [Erysipelotrichaceae bacterium]
MPMLYGDRMIHDLCLFIVENEECITRKAIIQAMRGTKIQLHVDIRYTKGSGIYNIFKEEDISHKIDVLIENHIVYEKYVHNLDYSFYMLKPYDEAYIIAKRRYYEIDETYNKYHHKEVLNDYECELIFHDMVKKDILETQDYLNIYQLCDNIQFYCFCKDEILHIFHECPENINKMLRMYYSIENDKMKRKILRQILKS